MNSVDLIPIALAGIGTLLIGGLIEAAFKPVVRYLLPQLTFWFGSVRAGGVQRVEWPSGERLLKDSMRVFGQYEEETSYA